MAATSPRPRKRSPSRKGKKSPGRRAHVGACKKSPRRQAAYRGRSGNVALHKGTRGGEYYLTKSGNRRYVNCKARKTMRSAKLNTKRKARSPIKSRKRKSPKRKSSPKKRGPGRPKGSKNKKRSPKRK